MLRNLSAKLLLILASIFLGVFFALAYITYKTGSLYLDEVNQQLNRKLAANVLKNSPELIGGKVGRSAIRELFHTVMSVNPSVEMYLIGSKGKVLESSPTQNQLMRDFVSIKRIEQFLSNDLLIYGEDPRDLENEKVFSAAPLPPDANHLKQGDDPAYLYIILAGKILHQ